MPRMNIDEEAAKIFKPIEFIIDGKEYTVEKIESVVLENIIDSGANPRSMREAFSSLVGAKKDTFKHTDSRKLTLAMRQITEVTKQQIGELDSKNAQGEGVVPNP